jgi:signal transduction histidine kinase
MNGFYVAPFINKILSDREWKKGNSALSKQIKTIAEDRDGNIWMGTPSGLYILNKKGEIKNEWHIGKPLVNDFIYGILRDNNDDMWFSHNKGLTRYDHKKKTFKSFSVDDGLQANEFNTGAYFKSASGELFFGGINGVNSFFPEDIKDNTNIPSIQITRIEVNDKPFSDSLVHWAKRNITLDYTNNTLAFEFAGLEFTEPMKNQYASRLLGIDKDWVYSDNKRFARYADIPPGNYTFQVKASNNDGVWNETPTTLSITVVPPFWQTWWFIVLEFSLGIAAIALIVLAIVRQRYKAKLHDLEIKHQVQLDRERISRELHDNIGTQLSQLSSTLDWAGKNFMSESERQSIITSGLQTTREVISDLRESIWALKKTEIPFTELADKLKTSVRGMSPSGKVVAINFVEELDSVTLTSEEALDLLRIGQEAVNNSLKHSKCSVINISIRANGKGYEIKIEDNGRGFETEKKHDGHYGLEHMKERSKQIGAQFSISSDKELGTTIIVEKGFNIEKQKVIEYLK